MQSGLRSSGHPSASSVSSGLASVPLFLAASLFAVGILLSHAVYLGPPHLLVAIAVLIVLAAFAAFRTPRIDWLPMAVLWILIGAWCAEMQPQPAPESALLSLSDGLLRTIEGTVTSAALVRQQTQQNVDEPAAEVPTQRIDVRLSTIEYVDDTQDRQVPLSGSVRLTLRWPQGMPQRIPCGERVRVAARLLPPAVYHDPGAWNRADYLLASGITSTATVDIERVERLGLAPGASLACMFSESQQRASARFLALPSLMHRFPAALRMSQNDAIMLTASITGDRTFLGHSLRVGFERTGSFHLLVVSGFHLALVAGCVVWLARRLRIPRLPTTLLTIAVSLLYALFTGFAPPVQRSFWMITIYLAARLVYRDRNVLNAIGFAALCLLVVNPRVLFESSFQMTLLAVVSIGGIATPLLAASVHPYLAATRGLAAIAIDAKLPPRIAQFRVTLRLVAGHLQPVVGRRAAWRFFPSGLRFLLRVFEAVVVSLVVELAMTLPMAVWFHRITVVALPVNLLILPLLAVLMPAALITLAVLLIWPAAATVPAAVVALFLHLGVGLIHLFGSFQWGDMRVPTPLAWQSAGFWLFLALAIALASMRAKWSRRSAWAALLAAGLIAVAPRPVQHPRNALLVEAIDVGQGDSILLVTPEGKSLLVDAGGFGGGPRQAPQEFDFGEEVVSAALWSRGIRHLDAVALSHAHSDHMGGMSSVLRNFHPAELWIGNNPHFAAYDALLDEAHQLRVATRTLRAGDAIVLGSARIHVFAPLSTYSPKPEPSNNDSLVLRVAYGATSILLEGDAEAPIEQEMLAEQSLGSTVLKIGHHGSTTSTIPEFLARVAPRWAVISCGLRNRYHHPRIETLNELQSAQVRTYSTDVNGAVCFHLDGNAVHEAFCDAEITR